MHRYLSLDIISSSKLTVFLELRSRKTVQFSEQIMEAIIVYIILCKFLVSQDICNMYVQITKMTIIINLLLTEHKGCTGEYWPEVVAVPTSLRSVRTKTMGGQYSPVRVEQARLVRSLLHGTCFSCKF